VVFHTAALQSFGRSFITKAGPCKGERDMNKEKSRSVTHWTTQETAKMALVTSLYVVVTVALAVVSFGAVQIRLSEMFNYLALYNKRYIWAITLGVAIANFSSPNGLLDVVVGSVCTFLVLVVNHQITKRIQNMKYKMVITAIVFALSMFNSGRTINFFIWFTLFL